MDIELHSPLRGSNVNIWRNFLANAGLAADADAAQTVLVWDEERLIATGSRTGNLLKYIAVDPPGRVRVCLPKCLPHCGERHSGKGSSICFFTLSPQMHCCFLI